MQRAGDRFVGFGVFAPAADKAGHGGVVLWIRQDIMGDPRSGGVVPRHSSGVCVSPLYRSSCHAMPMRGWDWLRRWPLAIRRRIGRTQLARSFMSCSWSGTFVFHLHNDPGKPSGTWCSRTRWHRIDYVAVLCD